MLLLSSLWRSRLPLIDPLTLLTREMRTPVILCSSTTLFALISPLLMSYGSIRLHRSSIVPQGHRVAIKVKSTLLKLKCCSVNREPGSRLTRSIGLLHFFYQYLQMSAGCLYQLIQPLALLTQPLAR